jgi:hypothetical protein
MGGTGFFYPADLRKATENLDSAINLHLYRNSNSVGSCIVDLVELRNTGIKEVDRGFDLNKEKKGRLVVRGC